MRYNLLKFQQHNLQQRHKDTVPPEDVLHHFLALATAVEADRTMIFLAYTRLIGSVAIGYISPRITLDDLVSEGVMQILRAIDYFDVGQNRRFGAYAATSLRNHFGRYRYDEAKRSARYKGLQVAVATATAPEQSTSDEGRQRGLEERLTSIIEGLNPREKQIVFERLSREPGDATMLEELGRQWRVTKQAVHQLELRTLDRLRGMLSNQPELADLLPDAIFEEWQSTRESNAKQHARNFRASLLLLSPLRTQGPVRLSQLIDWADAQPDNDTCVALLPSALQYLQSRGAVVATFTEKLLPSRFAAEGTRTDSRATYSLAQSAQALVHSLSQRLSKGNVDRVTEYLDALSRTGVG